MIQRSSMVRGMMFALVLSNLVPVAVNAGPTDVAGRLHREADAVVAAGAPGIVVLFRDGNRTVYVSKGLGNKATGTPIRHTDRFRIASLTKTFVAAAVLQLVGENRLSLSTPIERWLPGLVPDGKAITLRHLLNHTSGVFDYWKDPRLESRLLNNLTYTWHPKELVALATSHRPGFAPGAGWSYSNTNYALAGMIVEAATGRPLGTELRRRIFSPLQLRATTYPAVPQIDGPHAHGYMVLDKPPARDVTMVSPSVAGAAGGIVSTADDVARFFRALLSGRVLGADLVRTMQTTVATNGRINWSAYGLGLASISMPCGTGWGHQGEFAGYQAFALNSNDGARQVVVLVNTIVSGPGEAAIKRLLTAGFCG